MAEKIKKHWDLVLVGGIGLTLAIIGMLVMSEVMVFPNFVSAATTSATTVNVTATVAETIEITVTSTTMDLGALTTGAVASTSDNFTVKTNASGGYTVNLKDKDYAATSSLSALHKLNTPTDEIVSASTTLTVGAEGYGAQGSTSDGDVTINAAYLKTGNAVGAVSTTDQLLATGAAATTGDQSTLKLLAAISTITYAGSYEDQLTLTAVGSF